MTDTPRNPIRTEKGWVYPALAVIADRVTTIPFWELESNPIVTELGMVPWILLTVILLGALIISWDHFNLQNSDIAVFLSIVITTLHLITAVSNVGVVLALYVF